MTESIFIAILSFLRKIKVKSSQDLTAFFSLAEAKKVVKELVPSVVEEQENDKASVEFLGEFSNSQVDYPHCRLDCIEFAIGKDPMKYCGNCFCVLCVARVADGCIDWNAHCSISKQDYKVLVRTHAVASLAVAVPVPVEEGDYEEKQKLEVKQMMPAAVVELVPKTEEQGRAKDRDFILSLLKMEEKELKPLCKVKNIKLTGDPNKKEQLHCKLVSDYFVS